MARQAQVTEQDREFLRQVLALHEEFAGAEGDSPESRAGVADARYRVGMIRRRLGETRRGGGGVPRRHRPPAAARRRVPRPARATAATWPDATTAWASCCAKRAGREQAEEACTDRRRPPAEAGRRVPRPARLPPRPGRGPQQPRRRPDRHGPARTGGGSLRAAVDIMQKLVADSPAQPDYRSLLAAGHQNLGNLLFATGRPREAEECYRAGRDLFQKLADEFPRRPDYRRDLARSHNNLGALCGETGRPQEAEEAFRAAIAIQRKLAAELPDPARVPPPAWPRATTTWASCCSTERGRRRAEEAYRAARDVLATARRRLPRRVRLPDGLAATLGQTRAPERPRTTRPRGRSWSRPAPTTWPPSGPNRGTRPTARRTASTSPPRPTCSATSATTASAADAADELARFAHDPAEDAYTAARLIAQCGPLAGQRQPADRGGAQGTRRGLRRPGHGSSCERRCGTASRTATG